jgi:hypothetical protein
MPVVNPKAVPRRELVSTLLADHPVHLQSASLASFMRSFSENEKLQYEGVAQDGK